MVRFMSEARNHGFPWVSMGFHGFPWVSFTLFEYGLPWHHDAKANGTEIQLTAASSQAGTRGASFWCLAWNRNSHIFSTGT